MTPSESEKPLPANDCSGDVNAADAILDSLLTEVLTGQSPPDQSEIILSRLQQQIVCTAATARKSSSASASRRKSIGIHSIASWKVAVVTAATLLLCVGIAVGVRYRNSVLVADNAASHDGLDVTQESAENDRAGEPLAGSASDPEVNSRAQRDRVPAPPIALADASESGELSHRDPIEMFVAPDAVPSIALRPAAKPVAQSLTLVSASLADHLTHYWDRVGVQPAPLLPPEQTAKRLAARLHVPVVPQAVGDSQAMLSLLSQQKNADLLAGSVLEAISSRTDGSLTRPVDQQMITEVARQLREGRGFDRLVASWFVKNADAPEDSGDANAPVVASMGSLLGPLSQHEAVVSAGALLLGSDMRCVRCHDLPASGGNAAGSQHEYWQFAASLSPWLEQKSNAPSGWFYDTLDGRRRLAEAKVEYNFPQDLVGSRPLAVGLVGAMWQMVHGRPLTSTPYDLSGSADDSDLQQLRNDLADDLIASDFHLLRTISLIMTDSVVGRSTPGAMTHSGLLTASADEWIRAVTAVESFAAAPPASMPSSRIDRMNLVLNELPNTGSIDVASKLLAQPLISDDLGLSESPGAQKFLPAEMPKPSPATVAGLPVRTTIVMPAWMGKLPDFDSRLEHIANLAGLADVPEDVKLLAGQLRDGGVDETLILQRIWWIVRPQD